MKIQLLNRAPTSYNDEFMEGMAQAYLQRTPWTQLRLAAVEDLVEPRTGDRVVDLGCAAGAITHFLSGFGCKVVGVDLEERAVRKASSLFPALHFEQASVTKLPFPADSFDKAVAAEPRRAPRRRDLRHNARRVSPCTRGRRDALGLHAESTPSH